MRRASGFREYSPDSVRDFVRFIKQAQTLGFTLDEIAQLLRLAAGMPRNCGSVRSLATLRIDEMERKIAMLQAVGQKESKDPILLCYCFEFTVADLRSDLIARGETGIPE